jgi:hypothetical protein
MANLPMRGDVINEYDPKSDTSLGTDEPWDSSQVGIGLPELVILTAQRRRKRQASYPPPLRRPGTSSHPLGGGCLTLRPVISIRYRVVFQICTLVVIYAILTASREGGQNGIFSELTSFCPNTNYDSAGELLNGGHQCSKG